jgi:type II restriction/modification system DNA methylase subunit YeeA
MNKTALKNFATNARRELIEKVKANAFKIGITEENIKKTQFESSDAIYIDGKQLTATEKKQREKLISRIKEIGYAQVVEEVAYTWFNRFTALRFMEVNNYLPTKVRVLSSSNSESSDPDIIKEALTIDLDTNRELVYELKLNNKTEELFKYLVIKQCNSLHKVLPIMFEKIDDYKEILFPEGVLAKESFLREMTNVTTIPESDWEQVEIIGWLYQFYISDKKDQVFAELKNNIKVSKENIPAATQLFTPNWIVRYMVENSLGRIWIEDNPNTPLKSSWKYYIEDGKQEEHVRCKLEELLYKNVNPEEITFLDPCCGSGHILVYAFDVLFDMYLEKGYVVHEIPKLILEKNLFGLDIDDRAVQIASFAIMMKAREKSRRVFGQDIQLNICVIQESNWMTDEMITDLSKNQNQCKDLLLYIRDTFWNAKEFGSLIRMKQVSFEFLEERFIAYKEENANLLEMINKSIIEENLPLLLKQSKILSKKYDVLCTNPPYMGNSSMSNELKDYVQKQYDKSKADIGAAFIEAGLSQTKENGYCSLITMHSWFFLNSYESLRKNVLKSSTIKSILHLGMEAFEGIIGKVVQTAAFVLQNNYIEEYKLTAIRLVDFYDGRKYEKEPQFYNPENKYCLVKQSDFSKIPGSPIAYWVNETVRNIFVHEKPLGQSAEPRQGMATSDNKRFLRYWHEVNINNTEFGAKNREEAIATNKTWFPYNKGGAFRKWYGNNEYVVNWKNDGAEIKRTVIEKYPYLNGNSDFVVKNQDFYFKKGITWTKVSSSAFSVRYTDYGYIFSDAGMKVFIREEDIGYLCAFLNSKIVSYLLNAISETLNYEQGNIEKLPLKITEESGLKNEINRLVEENIELSKAEWDSFETSWDFIKHPLLTHKDDSFLIKSSFYNWKNYINESIVKMRSNEERINSIFINIYGLHDELTPDIFDEDVTLRKAEIIREIKSFISYSIGFMLGRYSLDNEGLVFAGGNFELEKYQRFKVDKDNILPILSTSYFEDDTIKRFVDFVKITFGEEKLADNLDFIAISIGKKEGETALEAIRRYFVNDFFKEHLQTYKKRPIYWLFTSGKQKAFNCLVYMHRYDKYTLSRIRTDYLHELQIRMDAEKKALLDIINGDGSAKEVSNAKKELKSLDLKIDELREYDEKLHHMADMQIEIDLDDGVAVNYAKFAGLLAPIK